MCAALALLELPPSEALPPLECLFTVDEETGLTGEELWCVCGGAGWVGVIGQGAACGEGDWVWVERITCRLGLHLTGPARRRLRAGRRHAAGAHPAQPRHRGLGRRLHRLRGCVEAGGRAG